MSIDKMLINNIKVINNDELFKFNSLITFSKF